jgi:hypothetical protein
MQLKTDIKLLKIMNKSDILQKTIHNTDILNNKNNFPAYLFQKCIARRPISIISIT